jgi:hypothetical protein
VFGGVESQLATDGTITFAAVNNLPVTLSVKGAVRCGSGAADPARSVPARFLGSMASTSTEPQLHRLTPAPGQ